MFPEEAHWFYDKIVKIGNGMTSPMLNLGSSTEIFRKVTQPHIDGILFSPLKNLGFEVSHCDIKQDKGVDFAGDIQSEDFANSLAEKGFKSIVCSNLLEHIEKPELISHKILQILPKGGYVFVSCPYRYPHHPDPIDTMFRPNPQELARLFPGTQVVYSEILTCGRYGGECQSLKDRLLEIVRVLFPFYKPSRWVWHFKRTGVTCLVLKK